MNLLAKDGIRTLASSPTLPTSCLGPDVAQAVRNYRRLATVLPSTAVHYVVGADPHPRLLAAIVAAGGGFAVTGPAEVRACRAAGARPEDLVCSHPIERSADVVEAAGLGVRLFVVGSVKETLRVAEAAPGSAVLCRIHPSGRGPDRSMSRSDGCSTGEAVAVLLVAAERGLDPAGVAFHVGSRQRDPHAWRSPIAASAHVFGALRETGLRPWLLDLGGGFPTALEGGAPPLALYGASIDRALRQEFGVDRPRTLVEPGRAIAGAVQRSAAIR